LQKSLATRKKNRRSRLVTFKPDKEEEDLEERTFKNLADYSRLKPAASFRGHCRSNFPMRQMSRASLNLEAVKKVGKEGMLVHSSVVIAEALTMTPEGQAEDEYEGAAMQNFWNVLVCMTDRPAQNCQRSAAREAILSLATDVPWVRGEVYVQIMKQLIDNPSSRSASLGWELLHTLCQAAPPDEELAEFVRAFVSEGGPYLVSDSPSMQLWAKNISEACLESLDRGGKPQAVWGTGYFDFLWNELLVFACSTSKRTKNPQLK